MFTIFFFSSVCQNSQSWDFVNTRLSICNCVIAELQKNFFRYIRVCSLGIQRKLWKWSDILVCFNIGYKNNNNNNSQSKGLSASCCTVSKNTLDQAAQAGQTEQWAKKNSNFFYRLKLKRSSRRSYKYLWSYTLDHPKWLPGPKYF